MQEPEPTLAVVLTADQMRKLQERAAQLGITPEELARVGIVALLDDPDPAFEQAVEYVLQKNADLYRRLA
jgi:antitoxin FitA